MDVYCPVCSFPLGPRGTPFANAPVALWLVREIDPVGYMRDEHGVYNDIDDLDIDLRTEDDWWPYYSKKAAVQDAAQGPKLPGGWWYHSHGEENENLHWDANSAVIHQCCHAALQRQYGDHGVYRAIVETLAPSPLIGAWRNRFQWAYPGVANALAHFDAWVQHRVTHSQAPVTLAALARMFAYSGDYVDAAGTRVVDNGDRVLSDASLFHTCDICKADMCDVRTPRCAMYTIRANDACADCVVKYTDVARKRCCAWLAGCVAN